MEYKPKVITGKVTGTGWPIDGHVLWFSQWDYDNRESWHLYGWEDSEDEAVMQTVFQTEKVIERNLFPLFIIKHLQSIFIQPCGLQRKYSTDRIAFA